MVANIRYPSDLFFGDFRTYSESKSVVLLLMTIIFSIVVYKFRHDWTIYCMGDEIYRNLRDRPKKFIYSNLLLILFSTAIVTYFYGVFSLLGLLFPYIYRSIFRSSHVRNELMWIGLFSGCVLGWTDSLCYYVPIYSSELPAGLIVALLGPFVLILRVASSFTKI
jgi:ABC-type Fe3+-siderophore transport system permease subunit